VSCIRASVIDAVEIGDGRARLLARTPEARLLLAVVLQAVVDAGKEDGDGQTARAFLDDPQVQDLVESVWGLPVSAQFGPHAGHAVRLYRVSEGKIVYYRHRRGSGSRERADEPRGPHGTERMPTPR
jgi:hypothetical protein